MRYHLCALLALASYGIGAAVQEGASLVERQDDTPPPPSQDAFYKPPTGFRQVQPGTILRYRSVPNNLNAQIPNIVTNISTTYQILFRTTDAIGKPAAAVTTLFVPSNPDPQKLLSYQFPYDTPNADCAPSYAFRLGDPQGIPTPQGIALVLLMISAVNKGWYVSMPDHEGLTAALNVVPVQGHATLDALRASLRSGSVTGLSPNAGAATWGYSGGALAGDAAAELQGSYAPELNLVGSAFGGIGLGSTIEPINAAAHMTGPQTARIANSLLGIANAYPNMSTYLNNQLVPATAAQFRTGLRQCLTPRSTFKGKTVADFFRNPATAITAPVPRSLVTFASAVGIRGTPKAPLHIAESVKDELIPIAQTDALVAQYCNDGGTIEYVRDSVNNHVQEGIASTAEQLRWLQDRLNGVPQSAACRTSNVTITSVPSGPDSIFGQQVGQALAASYRNAGGG